MLQLSHGISHSNKNEPTTTTEWQKTLKNSKAYIMYDESHRISRMCCVLSCSVVSNSLWAPWTVVRQAPLSMGFSRQEYWSGLPCSPPGDLPNPGSNPGLLHCRQILYCLGHQGNHVLVLYQGLIPCGFILRKTGKEVAPGRHWSTPASVQTCIHTQPGGLTYEVPEASPFPCTEDH